MRSPAAPGALFSLTAFILLLLCSLSTPVIKSSASSPGSSGQPAVVGVTTDAPSSTPVLAPVFFLKAEVATEIVTVNVQGTARFGVFGWCTGDINATSVCPSLPLLHPTRRVALPPAG